MRVSASHSCTLSFLFERKEREREKALKGRELKPGQTLSTRTFRCRFEAGGTEKCQETNTAASVLSFQFQLRKQAMQVTASLSLSHSVPLPFRQRDQREVGDGKTAAGKVDAWTE